MVNILHIPTESMVIFLGDGSSAKVLDGDDPLDPSGPSGDSRIGHVFRSEFPYEINKTEPGLMGDQNLTNVPGFYGSIMININQYQSISISCLCLTV